MARKFLLFLLLSTLYCWQIHAQGVKFITPIGGVYLKDYFLINYVDEDAKDVKDPYCGSKTYAGHQGTDFVIRSFRQMDSLVPVYAAAKGKVIITKDSLFDRNKDSNNLGLGNYIGIQHEDSIYSYYGHLKKYSLKVKKGDSVQAGDLIGYVGSSGFALSPHLHFEAWRKTVLLDVFNAKCSSSKGMWQSQLAYDTVLRVMEAGFVPYVPKKTDSLAERIKTQVDFLSGDKFVTYWALMGGLHKNDSIMAYWYKPDGSLWFSYKYASTGTFWYYYFWTYINKPAATMATASGWKCKLSVNGVQLNESKFNVVPVDAIEEPKANLISYKAIIQEPRGWAIVLDENADTRNFRCEIYDLQGRNIASKQTINGNIIYLAANVSSGQTVVLRLSQGNNETNLKLVRP